MRVTDIRPWVAAGVVNLSERFGWVPGRWVQEALCAQADPEAWFPEGKGNEWRHAARICDDCPVKDLCLAYAVVVDEQTGVWGGLSTKQRDRLASITIPGTNVVVKLLSRIAARQVAQVAEVTAMTKRGDSAESIAQSMGVTKRTVVRLRGLARESTEQQRAAA